MAIQGIDGLHLALLGLLFTIVGGLVVFFLTRGSFVRCSECKERHDRLDERLERGDGKFKRIDSKVNALVVYNERIPEDKKAELVGEGE